MTTLALPLTDLEPLRRHVAALAENRPAVYRILDPTGRVVYVGKAKRLRNRLLSYFRARYPDDKAARILHAAADIQWDHAPSEFAAFLGELRQIQRFRPIFNVRMNRNRHVSFVKLSSGPAPKLYVGQRAGPSDARLYGPFTGTPRLRDGIRVLNDLLGLRDCALTMPITYREQGDLFGDGRRAGCLRQELGSCTAPCAGYVTESEYRRRVHAALAFLEARAISPLDSVVAQMTAASDGDDFERAAWWREKFERLEWLLAATVRAQAAVAGLTFVYEDPGLFGDDRAYIIRSGTVRASAPAPRTPIEREAFRALVREHHFSPPEVGALTAAEMDEVLLLLQWFRRHPSAYEHTTSFETWLQDPAMRQRAFD